MKDTWFFVNFVIQMGLGSNCSGVSSYADSFQFDFRIPGCYNMSKPKDLPESTMKDFPDTVLFYMFYNMPND